MPPLTNNIGPAGRRRRYVMGAVLLAVGVVATAVLVGLGIDRGFRVALFAPFWAGALGIFQAQGHT